MTYPPHPDFVLREHAVSWHCRTCGVSGALPAQTGRRGKAMWQQIENMHAECSPECPQREGSILINFAQPAIRCPVCDEPWTLHAQGRCPRDIARNERMMVESMSWAIVALIILGAVSYCMGGH